MKVVLVDADAPRGQHHGALTVGREYEVLGIECDSYRLLDDAREPVLFDPKCFEVVEPQEPVFWVSRVGDEGERYAYPPGWGVPGFFEAWHDENEVVRRVFAEQLGAWYPEAIRGQPAERVAGADRPPAGSTSRSAKIEKDVEFGLERFSNERKVEIPLRDALYAFKVIGEFIAFFHQPDQWKSLPDIERFIGDKNEGAFHVLCEAYYERLRDVWPDDVQKALDEGLLDRKPIDDAKTD